MEEWKDILGYEGLYQISNLGNIKSLERYCKHYSGGVKYINERILKLGKSGKGYLSTTLNIEGVKKNHRVHQLVAIHFLDFKPNGMENVIDHIDNDKLNNKFDNLQIVTNRFNCSKDKKNKSSIYTGVSFKKDRNKFTAQIRINSKIKYLGQFDTEYEASLVYNNVLKQLEYGTN